MALRFTNLGNGLLLVTSRSKTELGMTFLRPQEFYESSNAIFRTMEFSVAEYRRWYAAKNGRFSYCSDWTGFNVSAWHLNRFDKVFRRKTKREELLLRRTAQHQAIYVIGALEKDRATIQHEIAHALFDRSVSYRIGVQNILGLLSGRDRALANAVLRGMGYAEAVLEDELQAYLLFDCEELSKRGFHAEASLRELLRRQYDQYVSDLGWSVSK